MRLLPCYFVGVVLKYVMNVMYFLGAADCDTDATVVLSHRGNAWLQCRLSEEPGQVRDSRIEHNILFPISCFATSADIEH